MRILQLLVVCRIIIVVPWQCASPFLWSHNSAVVFGAATVHWIMAPREEVERIMKPILFILRSFQASKYVILCNTLVFAKAAPQIFSPYYEEFFVCSSDSYQTRALKLEILSTMATESSVPIILEEFEEMIVRLACNLDKVKEPAARALIVWIIGEYNSVGQIIPKVVPSVLKYLAWTFMSEELETKLQILNTAAKVLLCAHGEDLLTFRKILSYIIELSKYDLNYDVRDRACFILKLMSHNLTLSSEEEISSFALQNGGIHHEFAEKIFSGKIHSGIAKSLRIYIPGSLSQIVFHAAPGYEPLPQPRSLHAKNINLCTEFGYETKQPDLKMDKSNSFGTDDPDISSGSLFEESGSVYDSHHYFINSDGEDITSSNSNEIEHSSLVSMRDTRDDRENTLINISYASADYDQASQSAKENLSAFISTDLAELISKSSLESWLDERPGLTSAQMPQQPSGRISINNLNCTVTPKLHMLLDPTNSNGLRADYAFSYEISTVSPVLVLIEVFFLELHF
ncbi:unnamed protein product [Musa acuminata subsp. burmannicoides]